MTKKKAMTGDIPVHCSHDEIVDIVKLVGNPRNPNTHTEEQIELLARIIKGQGWRKPITVSNRSGFIVSGHGRLQAAVKLGLTEAPVDYQDYANEAEEWADLVADNRIAELSEINEDLLGELLNDINDTDIDILLTGYDYDEIESLLAIEQEYNTDVYATSNDTTQESSKKNNSNDTGEIDITEYDEENYEHECPRCNFKW